MNKIIMCIGLAVISHVASGMDPDHHTHRGGGRSEELYIQGGDVWEEKDLLVTFQKLPTDSDAKNMEKCSFRYGVLNSLLLDSPFGVSGLWYSTEKLESVGSADKQKKVRMIIQEQCKDIPGEIIMVVISSQEPQAQKSKLYCIEKKDIEALNK